MSQVLSYVPSYHTDIDSQIQSSVDTDYLAYYDLNNLRDLKRAPNMDLDVKTFPGHTKEQLSVIESKFNELQKVYTTQTHEMELVNKLANVSDFMDASVSSEYSRVNKLRDRTYSNVHKMRHHFMMSKYDINYNRFVSGIFQFTLFTTIIGVSIFMMTMRQEDPMSMKTAGWVIGSIFILYILILIVFVKHSFKRRKDDWDKYYFGNMDKNSDKKSCSMT